MALFCVVVAYLHFRDSVHTLRGQKGVGVVSRGYGQVGVAGRENGKRAQFCGKSRWKGADGRMSAVRNCALQRATLQLARSIHLTMWCHI